ncbi:hexaprenyl-diphosphate synthase [Pseudohyphozyma bogoriensis]|nr:hexaprenyl-diphosphate synthase [Pseudohyphozyma bogoriensis]
MAPRPRAPSALLSSLHPRPSSLLLPSELAPKNDALRANGHGRTAWTSAAAAAVAPSLPFGLGGRTGASEVRIGGGSVPVVDPIKLLGKELGLLRNNVQSLLGSGHPALDTIAKYYFQGDGGKHIRPLIVLLMSQATNGMAPNFAQRQKEAEERESGGIDDPLEPVSVLNDANPLLGKAKAFLGAFGASSSSTSTPSDPASFLLLPSQRRLAEITEMIHVASLLHDDVIDVAETRRSAPSSPSLFGNKLTILAGDFLLARASLALSRLGSNEVVELVASVLANLVEGEVMQMKGNSPEGKKGLGKELTPEIFEHYMKKTYLKTASLIAKSTRATTILGGCGTRQGWAAGEPVKDIAYEYGKNIGIAFQLVDDMLDFTATASQLGKPGGGADLKLGLATAPALYAWEEFPELGEMIERKFAQEDDVERARYLIGKSSGLDRTRELAGEHAAAARRVLEGLPESEAREALDKLALESTERKK